MLEIARSQVNKRALEFCDAFKFRKDVPKFVFGCNSFAESIASAVEVDGFIDDFTDSKMFFGKPVFKAHEVRPDSLIVSSVLGKPFLAEKRIKSLGLDYLDYFAFLKYSGLNVKQIDFWAGFDQDIADNFEHYDRIYQRLADEESKNVYQRLLNFKMTHDLAYMRGFADREKFQYFEDFLCLKSQDESFVDIGGYGGETTVEFVKKCPQYFRVHFFEPGNKNMLRAKNLLRNFRNIYYHECGLSNLRGTVRFQQDNSRSRVSDAGDEVIEVKTLDSIIDEPVTFIKIDIEGAERLALEGSQKVITKYHPRLAIAVYHRSEDFWDLPELVLSFRDDYSLYLRHYTEGISETVMYFVPQETSK
jgi:FkbM family methyltransferase